MKNYILLLAILLLSTAIATAQTAEEYYKAGVSQMRLQKYPEALKEFSAAIKLNPAYENAYLNRAVIKFTNSDATAEADFNKAASLNPKNYKAWSYLGMIKFNAHEYQKAIEDEDKAIAIKPDYAEAWFYRGDAKMENKNYEGALADVNKAIALKEDFVYAYLIKGLIENQRKEYAAAIATFTRAIAFNDANAPQAYYLRDLAEVNNSQKDQACADFDKALSLGFQGAANAKKLHCN